MNTLVPWALPLAFGAGFLPGVAFALYALAASKRTAQANAALTQIQKDLELLRAENAELVATLARFQEQQERLEASLPQLRRDDSRIRHVLAQDRLRRTLSDLKRVREEWSNGRRRDPGTNESPRSSPPETGPGRPDSHS
jgi:septal ring factor EnvC (AmiA/AmiB activator)